MTTMSIGEFRFINLSRLPSGPGKSLARETFPGVNGCTLWDTGTRSEMFQVQSVVDCKDMTAAAALFARYEATKGGDPLQITFAGNQLDGLRVVVTDVMPIDEGTHATVIGVGGIEGTSNAMLRAVWTLQPIHSQKEARA